ncbi:D-alanine--D-alanine ligase [Emcibacter sp.]|uniref:D-alanine--D-alanine ligase n=1 Tax=Emcibacter sp. TaxID=1979954 RepID=UPI003A909270
MSKHVVVLKGGWSAEREVSLMSGAAVAAALTRAGYNVTELDVTPDVYTDLVRIKPDVAFNALHGRWGEDGCIQGLLEILTIPYTHSGVLASAVAMDKIVAKNMFRTVGIPCAEDRLISGDELFRNDPLPRPFVVKPANEGSSVGVVIVREGDNLTPDKPGPWQTDSLLMAEQFLPGRELTVSVMGDKALAVTELRPLSGFYDYEAKYQDGKTEHLVPAPLDDEMAGRLMHLALEAHRVLGCRGVSRADFRLDDGPDGDGIPYILEVNTQPGMTDLSLVPEQAAHVDISFEELVSWMVEDASCNR